MMELHRRTAEAARLLASLSGDASRAGSSLETDAALNEEMRATLAALQEERDGYDAESASLVADDPRLAAERAISAASLRAASAARRQSEGLAAREAQLTRALGLLRHAVTGAALERAEEADGGAGALAAACRPAGWAEDTAASLASLRRAHLAACECAAWRAVVARRAESRAKSTPGLLEAEEAAAAALAAASAARDASVDAADATAARSSSRSGVGSDAPSLTGPPGGGADRAGRGDDGDGRRPGPLLRAATGARVSRARGSSGTSRGSAGRAGASSPLGRAAGAGAAGLGRAASMSPPALNSFAGTVDTAHVGAATTTPPPSSARASFPASAIASAASFREVESTLNRDAAALLRRHGATRHTPGSVLSPGKPDAPPSLHGTPSSATHAHGVSAGSSAAGPPVLAAVSLEEAEAALAQARADAAHARRRVRAAEEGHLRDVMSLAECAERCASLAARLDDTLAAAPRDVTAAMGLGPEPGLQAALRAGSSDVAAASDEWWSSASAAVLSAARHAGDGGGVPGSAVLVAACGARLGSGLVGLARRCTRTAQDTSSAWEAAGGASVGALVAAEAGRDRRRADETRRGGRERRKSQRHPARARDADSTGKRGGAKA